MAEPVDGRDEAAMLRASSPMVDGVNGCMPVLSLLIGVSAVGVDAENDPKGDSAETCNSNDSHFIPLTELGELSESSASSSVN